MDEKAKLMKVRKIRKSKKPYFLRQEGKHIPSLRKKWVHPKGKQSKMRRHMLGKGHMPSPGYMSPPSVRGMHPSGLEDVLIFNIYGLDKIDNSKQAARIAAGVGSKKRFEIQKKAEEMKIRILNPKKVEMKKK